MTIINSVSDISFPTKQFPRVVSKKHIQDIKVIGTTQIEITLIKGASILFNYSDITLPVTLTITDLRDLLVNWKNNDELTQVFNYDCSDGSKDFAYVLKLPGVIGLQIYYSGLDNTDSVIALEQSNDGVEWNPVKNAAGTAYTVSLLSTFSSTLNAEGVTSKYVRASYDIGSVTIGTIEKLIWRFE